MEFTQKNIGQTLEKQIAWQSTWQNSSENKADKETQTAK
jgi:hypothetical protein